MPSPQSPRLAVLVAVLLAVIGVGLIVSGVVMVFDGDPTAASGTNGASTTVAITSGPLPTVVPAPTVTAVAPPEFAFVILADDTGTITLEAPSTWVDVNTGAWTSDGVDIGPSLRAAVDLAAWIEGWETPGLFVGVTDQIEAADAMGDFGGSCEVDRTESITVAGVAGTAQWWWSCGDAASSFFVGVVPLGAGTIILFQILDGPEALPVVVEHVLGSFRYAG